MGRSRGEGALVALLLARFVRARWGYRFRSRQQLDRWRRRRLGAFLARIHRAPFYRDVARSTPLGDLPVTDKGVLLEHFDELNTRGVRLADALGVALEAERTRDFTPTIDGDLAVGLSSGTSGRRAAFLVSPRERMLWAGTVLGRLLDGASVRQLLNPLRPPVRIAFFLRAGGSLYESVASSRIRFSFFDLTEPVDGHLARLADEARRSRGPEVLVAPASVLAALARLSRAPDAPNGSARIAPRLVISVAEVLDDEQRRAVREAWGVPTREVYQATEGLLALSCAYGALHLLEETVWFETSWLDAARTRFVPLVTDLERRTQIIARYRLDDVLRLPSPAASGAGGGTAKRCGCGRFTTVIAAVDGRADAVLRLRGADGRELVDVFPDAVRQAVATARSNHGDWRIRQTGLDVRVALEGASRADERAVTESLQALFARYGCSATVLHDPWFAPEPGVKVRRIVREEPS
ncbi:F390 synthetase-related protein [Herbiconiux sp.]|uniref:F390 synthetase-related protein n=1 Tax=Herbiconiux sp. TaxID=1871186 RepID=UPI0025C072EE|nr:F390 synthetase-related protein [Herbiconiux sp.]